MAKTRTKTSTLSSDEITALKQLAQLAPLLTNALQQQTQPQQAVEESLPTNVNVKKRGRPKKVKNDEADNRPVRAGTSKRLKERQSKGNATRHEPVSIKRRPNLFEKMSDFNAHKDDTEIDKKLWGNKKAQPRGGRSTTVDVECKDCGYEFTVSPNELRRTEVDGKIEHTYTCNECQLAR